jgi:hypothetical protein
MWQKIKDFLHSKLASNIFYICCLVEIVFGITAHYLLDHHIYISSQLTETQIELKKIYCIVFVFMWGNFTMLYHLKDLIDKIKENK